MSRFGARMGIGMLAAIGVMTATTFVIAQEDTAAKAPKIPQSVIDTEKMMFKISQLNQVRFLLPLLLKKKQYNDILLAIEKCRRQELEIREKDATEWLKFDKKVSAALKDGLEDAKMPSRELTNDLYKMQNALMIRRQIATGEMVDLVLDACKKTMDSGQLKAMAFAMDPKVVDPSLKTENLGEDARMKAYIRYVFLDGVTYDVMKILAKNAND
jgi:hypothetical protein